MNFCKRSYQPILRYLYTEVTKRWGEISLHKHFKLAQNFDNTPPPPPPLHWNIRRHGPAHAIRFIGS